jgi:hypothetical protein
MPAQEGDATMTTHEPGDLPSPGAQDRNQLGNADAPATLSTNNQAIRFKEWPLTIMSMRHWRSGSPADRANCVFSIALDPPDKKQALE